jgi:hypothetical protein
MKTSMKPFMKGVLFLVVLSTFSACRSKEFDPATGLTIQIDVQSQFISSNASKAGVPYEKTFLLNLRDTFEKRYNINADNLETFVVDTVLVFLNQDRCNDLQSYSVSTTLPVISNYTVNKTINGCTSLSSYSYLGLNLPAFVNLRRGKSNGASPTDIAFATELFQTDFAASIKQSKPFEITFKMTPKVDFDKAAGVIITLSSRATYKP